jgi:hypothetical protein
MLYGGGKKMWMNVINASKFDTLTFHRERFFSSSSFSFLLGYSCYCAFLFLWYMFILSKKFDRDVRDGDVGFFCHCRLFFFFNS